MKFIENAMFTVKDKIQISDTHETMNLGDLTLRFVHLQELGLMVMAWKTLKKLVVFIVTILPTP